MALLDHPICPSHRNKPRMDHPGHPAKPALRTGRAPPVHFSASISAESWGLVLVPSVASSLTSSLRPRVCALRRLRLSRSAVARRCCAAAFFRCLGWSLMPTRLRLRQPYGKDRASFGGRVPPASVRFKCCRSSVVEHPLGKGEVVSSILTGSTMFVGFFQCHASANFAERRGTMREHAAVWTQIGHTKSRSVHRFYLARSAQRDTRTFDGPGQVDCLGASS
jgi:hypothetical protein